jgi:hypothetical protein
MHEGNFKKTLEITTKSQSDMMGIYGKYNCNPLKSIAPMLVQAPTFITFFFSVHHLNPPTLQNNIKSRRWPRPTVNGGDQREGSKGSNEGS